LLQKTETTKIDRIQGKDKKRKKYKNRWSFSKRRYSRFVNFYNRKRKTTGGYLLE